VTESVRYIKGEKNLWRPSLPGRVFVQLLVLLPVPLLAVLGRGLGSLFYRFDRKRRHYADVNLRLCFPQMTEQEHRKLLHRHFKTLGQSLLCTLGINWTRPRLRIARYVTVEGAENLVAHDDKNVIVMAPHFIGLEMAFAWLSMTRLMIGMYREPRKNILHWAIDLRRDQFGCIGVEAQAQLKTLIRLIREGKPFFYLPDLDPGSAGRYEFAPFFGVQAATWTALGRIAAMTNAVVIPCFVTQHRNGRYTIRFDRALTDFPSGDNTLDAARMNRLIEEEVRNRPEQYFWIHRRFKTRPPGEAGFYGRKRTGYK